MPEDVVLRTPTIVTGPDLETPKRRYWIQAA